MTLPPGITLAQSHSIPGEDAMTGPLPNGPEGPLRPTQRFFNLQQLASTPENAFSVPVTCDKNNVNAAAFANIASGASYYSVSDGRLEVSLPADSFVSIFVN